MTRNNNAENGFMDARGRIVLPLLTVLALGATATVSAASSGSGASLQGKTIRVINDPSNTPFETRGSLGQIEGLNIDLMKEIAQRNGFDVVFIGQSQSNIFDFLDADKADLIASMTVPDENLKKKYLFSDSIHAHRRYLYVLPEVAEKMEVKSYADACKLTVAAKEHSDKLRAIQTLCNTKQRNIYPVSSTLLAIKYAATGKFQAAMGSDLAANYLMENRGVEKMIGFPDPSNEDSDVRWVMKQDNPELKRVIDDTMKDMKADGTYAFLSDKWLHPKND